MIRQILIVFVVLAFFWAQQPNMDGPLHKLSRGVVNTLTGWIELPKDVYEISVEDGPLLGFTLGVVEGLAMAIVRTGCGIYEIVTFPFAIPSGYKSPIKPELVWQDYETS